MTVFEKLDSLGLPYIIVRDAHQILQDSLEDHVNMMCADELEYEPTDEVINSILSTGAIYSISVYKDGIVTDNSDTLFIHSELDGAIELALQYLTANNEVDNG